MAKKYDIIIIGSGLGGLQSGVILSRKGYKVLILEKNHQIGGALQTFKRNGCEFSTGVHYIGNLDKGQTLNKVFKYLNLFDGIEYKMLDKTGFDIFTIDGFEYRFPIGFDNFKKQMYEYFPDEKIAIDSYMLEIHKAVETQNVFLLKDIEEKTKSVDKYLSMNTSDFIESLTENKRLRQVLGALNFVYAGVKEKSPFYLHAMINYHYISSSYRIVGNSGMLAKNLSSQIINLGGKILTNKNVINLVVENKKIVAVETNDGDKFEAVNIISNVHPSATMSMIAEGGIKKSFRNRMNSTKNTMSGFSVHLKLKKETVKYLNSNYYYYKQNNVWYASYYDEKNWPEHFFLHHGAPKGESKYVSCIGLLTHMKYDEVEKWKDLPVNNRGADYVEFKDKKAKALIELAVKNFPELADNIESYNVSTPLTYHDYLGSPTGSLYGTLRDSNNAIGSYISHRTKINNLFLTGQNLNLHGVLGVSLSSILTCGEFVGVNNLLKEINAEN